jgi:hypothetical protein
VGKTCSASQRTTLIKVRSHGLETEAPEFVGGLGAAGGTQYSPSRTEQSRNPLAYVAATYDQQTRATQSAGKNRPSH